MPLRSRQFLPLAAIFGSLLVAHGLLADEPQPGFRSVADKSGLSVLNDSKPVLHYRFADVRKKPYVDRLFSPSGVQVLRDGAPDHVHHHALMFAIRVDGVNFWEETTPDVGMEKHRSLKPLSAAVSGNARRAGFIEQLDWLPPTSDKPLLLERREIAAYNASDLGATLIEWRTQLELPPGKGSAVLTGTHYNGLGMRFVPSMDHVGRYLSADAKPGEPGPHECRLTATRWMAYTAKADGKLVTVALFDHPTSFRHPAVMFTKNLSPNWYSYLSATFGEWKQPVTLKAGKPLDLCYAVALWDGEPSASTIDALYQRWVKISEQEQPDRR
ncbi:MAG: PmoA family protein [Planctomycetaceae bacterium]|nr:PmoA family protein [Planctomycetaceae bacterium]